MKLPLGYSLRFGLRRHPEGQARRPGADRLRHASLRGGTVHDESRAGRAGAVVARAPQGHARHGQRDSGKRRQRQLRNADRHEGGPRLVPRGRQGVEGPRSPGASRFHRRDRRRAGCRPDRQGDACAGRGLGCEALSRCLAGHHDHGPDSQGGLRGGAVSNRPGPDRGHGQGRRDDPSEHGDHAMLRHDGRRHRVPFHFASRWSTPRPAPSTGSRWMATCPRTTPSSCWPTAPPA